MIILKNSGASLRKRSNLMPLNLIKLLTITFILSSTGYAEDQSFKCIFSGNYAYGQKSKDSFIPEIDKAKENILIFDKLNIQNQTGRLIGNTGAVDVKAYNSDHGINILETTPSGNMFLTSIFKTKDGYLAVHSRHTAIDENVIPQQYYGKCQKLNEN